MRILAERRIANRGQHNDSTWQVSRGIKKGPRTGLHHSYGRQPSGSIIHIIKTSTTRNKLELCKRYPHHDTKRPGLGQFFFEGRN